MLQLDDVQSSFAGLVLAHEGLRLAQSLGNLYLRQTGFEA
jgi:hypothetical protein